MCFGQARKLDFDLRYYSRERKFCPNGEQFPRPHLQSREGLPPVMPDVKCKSHVQRVAAIDCTDVEHAPIRARIAKPESRDGLTICRDEK